MGGVEDTDWPASRGLLEQALGGGLRDRVVCVAGTGGVARTLAIGLLNAGCRVIVVSRDGDRAGTLAHELASACQPAAAVGETLAEFLGSNSKSARIVGVGAEDWAGVQADAYINATPVGMVGGPDPAGSAVPVDQLAGVGEHTVFMDTVYTPIDTPMLVAARERGCRTIDGLSMFIGQAVRQFALWTDQPITEELVAMYREACERAIAERSMATNGPRG